MKAYIGPYPSWFGPYQFAELLCFWVKPVKDKYGIESKPDWVHNFGEWLAHGSIEPEPEVGVPQSFSRERAQTLLYKAFSWLHSRRKRTIWIHIDRWDSWSVYNTLTYFTLPLLKRLKDTKQGSPQVDIEDVPESMRFSTTEDYDTQYTFDFYNDEVLCKQNVQCDIHDRWAWVLDEMIFAFEHIHDDSWEEKFTSGNHDMQTVLREDGMHELITGPNDTFKRDEKAIAEVTARINNGLRLFGKYYQSLWD